MHSANPLATLFLTVSPIDDSVNGASHVFQRVETVVEKDEALRARMRLSPARCFDQRPCQSVGPSPTQILGRHPSSAHRSLAPTLFVGQRRSSSVGGLVSHGPWVGARCLRITHWHEDSSDHWLRLLECGNRSHAPRMESGLGCHSLHSLFQMVQSWDFWRIDWLFCDGPTILL